MELGLISLLINAGSKLTSWAKSPNSTKRLLAGEIKKNRNTLRKYKKLKDAKKLTLSDIKWCIKYIETKDAETLLNGWSSINRISYHKKLPDGFPKRLKGKYLDEILQSFVNNTFYMKRDIELEGDEKDKIKNFSRRLDGRLVELGALVHLMTRSKKQSK